MTMDNTVETELQKLKYTSVKKEVTVHLLPLRILQAKKWCFAYSLKKKIFCASTLFKVTSEVGLSLKYGIWGSNPYLEFINCDGGRKN